MNEDIIFEEVKDYIENEIENWEKQNEVSCLNGSELRMLKSLKNISDSDIENIVNNIMNDSELSEVYDNCINYYVYHN